MSGFLGPWFCSLFFNTSSHCKKQTHLEAHTYPHLAEDALNKTLFNEEGKRGEDNDDCWIIILKVGPFNQWNHAQNFLRQWAAHTRGKPFRLERGLHLFSTYQKPYNLTLWVQRNTREEVIERFLRSHEYKETIQNEWREIKGVEEKDEEEEEREKEVIRFNEDEMTVGQMESLIAMLENNNGGKQQQRKKHKGKRRFIKL